ncbi:peptidoglycan-binding domain-containing protein [Kitasatospora sp. NPDC096140]|uniref:peptidoglycan-binding domain-containing protein n=1 Tax=Kitasatospora sp. NPDC096140 TaxID=3155425 RepID=UPI003319CCCF
MTRKGGRILATTAAALLTVVAVPGAAEANSGAPYIGYGYPNSAVAVSCVQKFYNVWASNGVWITVDGKFGPMTEKAIRIVQDKINRVPGYYVGPPDGVVGRLTGTAMVLIDRDESVFPGSYRDTCRLALPTT